MAELIKKQDGESFRQYRERYFNTSLRYTKILEKIEYDKLHEKDFEQWGSSSPAYVSNKTHEVTICDDVPDKEFLDFLKNHEMWESYVTYKTGFNLGKFEAIDMRRPVTQHKRFAHRFATYKELSLARERGKLDAYIQWWKDFYARDIRLIEQLSDDEIERISKNYDVSTDEDARQMIINSIKSNCQLRVQIYEKVRAE